jgi:cell division protein FtsB
MVCPGIVLEHKEGDVMWYGSKIVFIIVFLGSALLLLSSLRGDHSVYNYFSLQRSKTILDDTVAGLEEEIYELEEEIDRIENSKSYALRVLKDKYHLAAKDEEILFFAD